MAGLTPKDRAELAYLYELNEFKAFKRLVVHLREKATRLIVMQNMAEPGADKQVAMLQGQIYALDNITEHWRKYYKGEIDKAKREKR